MHLKQLKTSDLETVSFWLSQEKNYQWLDFGNGTQKISAPVLKLMLQRKIHELRLFTSDESDDPIGLVALSDIDHKFRSAVLWYVLGNTSEARKKYTSRAAGEMIDIGFRKLNLNSIYAWTLEHNIGGRKVIENNNFRYIGKRRQCHYINGNAYDRLLYDLLNSEYKMDHHGK